MKLATWYLPLILALGCDRLGPPEQIAIGDLPEDVQVAAAAARDAWCAAEVGWCPELTEDSGAPIEIGHWDTEVSGGEPGAYGHNDNGAYIEISRNWLDSGTATVHGLTVVLIHEMGHWGNQGHAREGIMKAEHPHGPESVEPVVDAAAQALWCAEQDC
jgi:Zn-dependent protease with chaperone function